MGVSMRNKRYQGLSKFGLGLMGMAVAGFSVAALAQNQTLNTAPNKAVLSQKQSLNPSVIRSQAVNQNAIKPVAATQAPPVEAASVKNGPKNAVAFKPILLRPATEARIDWAQAVPMHIRSMSQAKPNPVMARLSQPDIDRTRLPVLLPRAGGMLNIASARMHSFGDAYTMSLPQKPGLQITLYGNRSVVEARPGALSKRVMARIAAVSEPVQITRTEDGFTATFNRYGIAYSIDVSCDDTDSSECTSEDYIRKAVADFSDTTLGKDAKNEAVKFGGIKPQALMLKPQPNSNMMVKGGKP